MKYIFALLLTIIYIDATTAAGPRILFPHYAVTRPDTDTIVRKQSVSLGVSYGSDATFFGRTGPFTYPYITGDAIYNTKFGLFAYGSVWKVIGSIPVFDELDLGGGYAYTPTKNFSGSLSYTRFFFNRDAEIIKSASANDINFKNSYNLGFIKPAIAFDYLFGQASDFFMTFSATRYFETNWSIFDDKDFLTFNPGVSMIVGTQNFVSKYAQDHYYTLDFQNIFLNGNNPAYDRRNSELNVLNYSFKLPIAYNRPHYTVEAAVKYSIPVNVEGALHNHKEVFFNLTFYYVFY